MQKVEICGVDTSGLPKLTAKENEELMKRIKAGDRQARDTFIVGNMRLVLSLVKRFRIKNLGADVVVGVDVLGPVREMDEIKSILSYILRVIDIYDSKVSELTLEKNPPDILCTPDLGNMSQYKIDSKQMQIAYEKGYECALNIVDDLKKKLQ